MDGVEHTIPCETAYLAFIKLSSAWQKANLERNKARSALNCANFEISRARDEGHDLDILKLVRADEFFSVEQKQGVVDQLTYEKELAFLEYRSSMFFCPNHVNY